MRAGNSVFYKHYWQNKLRPFDENSGLIRISGERRGVATAVWVRLLSFFRFSNDAFVVRIAYIIFLSTIAFSAFAQTADLSGTVMNSEGEPLPLANVFLLPDNVVATADAGGRFSFHTYPGQKTVSITYTGYETWRDTFHLQSDTLVTMTLITHVAELEEVTVHGSRYTAEDIVQSTRTGTTTLTAQDINAIPVLGGEADVIKTLQLLPGAVRGVEGSSDLFVRGGAADQNLVLLDGAPIYNTSHLFGFLSVFNPSILDRVEAINGGFPAEFGGRLSSILDITSNSDLAGKTSGAGDIGLIATRLYLEQPLVKEKASFWVAGRRTYIDQVVKLAGEEVPYFFYDFNGKLILQPSASNKVELSLYNGEDILDVFRDRNNDGNGFLTSFISGNTSQSLRWTHATPGQWTNTVYLTRSKYDYKISNVFEENELHARSDVEDYGARVILRRDSLSGNSTVQFGAEWVRHAISPSVINTTGTIADVMGSSASAGKVANELALHAAYEFPLGSNLRVNAGMRASSGITGGTTYFVPEPRLSIRYGVARNESLKVSYSRMAQYIHRISNSAVTTPTDVWYTVTDEIAPQTSHQVAMAWQRFIRSEQMFLSAEVYYKAMKHLVGYEPGTNLFFNSDFESKLLQGRGRAYGAELLLRKEAGKFTGWVTYTLAWSHRQFDAINGAAWFPSRYDRRHNGAVVTQYKVGKRWTASLVWEFISGPRFTPVIGQYAVFAPTLTGIDLIPIYTDINAVRLSDTHRLDAGIKFMSKPERRFQWHLFAGVYNIYNRASPVGIIIEENETDGSLRYQQPGLFGLLPFVSYGFNF